MSFVMMLDNGNSEEESPPHQPTEHTERVRAMATVTKCQKVAGIAGQYAYRVEVQYSIGEPFELYFYGSTYGGPIFMGEAGGHQYRVDTAVMDRIGHTLTPEWVRAFFSEKPAEV